MEIAILIQLNPKPAVKKRIGMQAIRISKCQSKQNIGLQRSGKAVEKDSGHFQVTQACFIWIISFNVAPDIFYLLNIPISSRNRL